jgi:hypothetical protein
VCSFSWHDLPSISADSETSQIMAGQGHEPILRGGDPNSSIGDHAKFGVVTLSDRASSGVYDDLSGPAVLQFFQEAILSR